MATELDKEVELELAEAILESGIHEDRSYSSCLVERQEYGAWSSVEEG